jgi:acetyl-CoA carboxylase biotin carboxyl carrier protein
MFLIPDRAVSLLRRRRGRARISRNDDFISMAETHGAIDAALERLGGKDLSATPITFQEVLQLVELVKSSANFSELRIRSGDLEIDVRRGLAPLAAAAASAPEAVAAAASAPAAAAPARVAAPAGSRAGMSVVKAPMVGTIYRAPEPGAAPFVQVGQQVAAGDQLCIIEVMKLMNAVVAEEGGTVVEVLAGDGAAVEFGQDLFVIARREPSHSVHRP